MAVDLVLSDFDLNAKVDFVGVVFRAYLNVPLPGGAQRPWAQGALADLKPATAARQTVRMTLPLPSEQAAAIQQCVHLGPGDADWPSLVITMLHMTRNKAGQDAMVEQGFAVVRLGGLVPRRVVVPFSTTFEHFNDEVRMVRTAHGVTASSAVACTVDISFGGQGMAGAPPLCDNPRPPYLGRTYTAVQTEYHALPGSRRPLSPNMPRVTFSCYMMNGCMLPGYMFFQELERQAVDDGVIEHAALSAALALAPHPASVADGAASMLAYLNSPIAKARPAALFQLALQLPSASCVYIPDEVELPDDFASHEMVFHSDAHRRGQTDTYGQMAVTSSGDYKHATASGDCEDRAQLMVALGLAAQAYVLRHLSDAPGRFSHYVARALQPVLAYVPAGCLVTIDEVGINGHMIGLYVQRALFPAPCNVAPWGAAGALPGVALPAAVYMDGTYLTVDTPCTAVGASLYARLASVLPEPSVAVENTINSANLPWVVDDHPSDGFVCSRLYCDVRSFAPPGTDWRAPAFFDAREGARLAPVWLPCNRERPGTYGIRLRDMCTKGAALLELRTAPVPPQRWAEMLSLLAWRHPPVPIEMRLDPDTFCEHVVVASDAPTPDLILPILIRGSSYTQERYEKLLTRASRVCRKRSYDVWSTQGTLNSVSGPVVLLTIVA
jgi:hypothetical protein